MGGAGARVGGIDVSWSPAGAGVGAVRFLADPYAAIPRRRGDVSVGRRGVGGARFLRVLRLADPYSAIPRRRGGISVGRRVGIGRGSRGGIGDGRRAVREVEGGRVVAAPNRTAPQQPGAGNTGTKGLPT